jgi:hypothetical protein
MDKTEDKGPLPKVAFVSYNFKVSGIFLPDDWREL